MGLRWLARPAGGAEGLITRRIRAAHEAALQDVANAARQRAPRRTGQYAGSIRATPAGASDGRTSGHIGSPLPQAGAVERGANVGPRRGPHMRGQPSIRPAAIQGYAPALKNRMRNGGGT